jgi:RNA polymerase sigma-32 factor
MEKRLRREASMEVLNPTTGRSLHDTLEISADSPEEMVASQELRARLRSAMEEFRETLDGRDRAIWDARIATEQPQTFQELGEEHGITRQRVQQVEQRLKKRFLEYLKQVIPEADAFLAFD